jgi:hypothetical protein
VLPFVKFESAKAEQPADPGSSADSNGRYERRLPKAKAG